MPVRFGKPGCQVPRDAYGCFPLISLGGVIPLLFFVREPGTMLRAQHGSPGRDTAPGHPAFTPPLHLARPFPPRPPRYAATSPADQMPTKVPSIFILVYSGSHGGLRDACESIVHECRLPDDDTTMTHTDVVAFKHAPHQVSSNQTFTVTDFY